MAESNIDPEAAAVTGVEEEEGTEEGQCPFVVHGLTGTTLEHLGKQHPHQIKLCAVEHFKSDGKVLGIEQAKKACIIILSCTLRCSPGYFPMDLVD